MPYSQLSYAVLYYNHIKSLLDLYFENLNLELQLDLKDEYNRIYNTIEK